MSNPLSLVFPFALALSLLGCSDGSASDGSSTGGATGDGSTNTGGKSAQTGTGGSSTGTTDGGARSDAGTGASFVLVDDGRIVHDRDYYKYTDDQSLPKNWLEPIPYADGTLVLELSVISTGDGVTSGSLDKFFYHVIIKRCYEANGSEVCGTKAGVLRAEIALDHIGDHRSEIPIRDLNTPFWEPGVDHPEWDYTRAWESVNGDLITQNGKPSFPVEVDVKVTIVAP